MKNWRGGTVSVSWSFCRWKEEEAGGVVVGEEEEAGGVVVGEEEEAGGRAELIIH